MEYELIPKSIHCTKNDQDEAENTNRLINSKDTDSIIKTSHLNRQVFRTILLHC